MTRNLRLLNRSVVDVHQVHLTCAFSNFLLLWSIAGSNLQAPSYEPFRCTRGPFVIADWIDSPMSGGEVGIVCAISYSDRVIRPRNTCVRTKLFDFSRPQTLESKKVRVLEII